LAQAKGIRLKAFGSRAASIFSSHKFQVLFAMACERPMWTFCFLFVWTLVVPGAVLTHLSLIDLLPYLKDLPSNIVQGFDETFKFARLEQDSMSVENAAATALQMCGVVANVTCPSGNYSGNNSGVANTSAEQAVITQSFKTSLDVVSNVANDKYFGVEDLKPTARSLNKIVADMNQLNETMTCEKSTPLFCGIYTSAGGIVAGMGLVTKAIDGFKTSEIVEKWDDYHKFLILLHGLPYVMVVALLFFTCFWMKGGVCCCCKGGTIAGLALIPFTLFWLLSFVIYGIVCITGLVVKYAMDKINVSAFNGNPNLKQVIDHIETNYPEFWNLVFANLATGLDLLLKASFFFVVASLIIALYSCCECLCCPYRNKALQEEKSRS